MTRVLVALVNTIGWLADRALTAFANLTDEPEDQHR